MLNAPLAAWMLPVFGAAYLLFFIWPVFFTPGGFKFFRYLPVMDPIGADLKETLGSSGFWASGSGSPYFGINMYSPATVGLFALLVPLGLAAAYKLLSLLTLGAYAILTLLLPLAMRTAKRIPAAFAVILVTGLISYGFQFELERGQFNVLAVMLAFVAIWIFHYHSRSRLLAYALFLLSVQLKLYPFVFALMLIRDWRLWRENLRRLVLLGLASFALLFVLGPQIFVDFLGPLRGAGSDPPIWVYNHSVRAFARMSVQRMLQRGYAWPEAASGWLEAALLLILVLCLGAIIVRLLRTRQQGFSAPLLLACTVVALVLPPLSNDYTLAVLAAPVAVLVLRPNDPPPADASGGRRLMRPVSNLALAAAYVSTLFAFNYKPHTLWLENNFPALFVMLLAVTALALGDGSRVTALTEAPAAGLDAGSQGRIG
jgi:hypothetical protein